MLHRTKSETIWFIFCHGKSRVYKCRLILPIRYNLHISVLNVPMSIINSFEYQDYQQHWQIQCNILTETEYMLIIANGTDRQPPFILTHSLHHWHGTQMGTITDILAWHHIYLITSEELHQPISAEWSLLGRITIATRILLEGMSNTIDPYRCCHCYHYHYQYISWYHH